MPAGPAAQCPAPMAACVTAGATGDTHWGIPEGLVPSRTDIKASRPSTRSPLLSRPIPDIVARAARISAKLPDYR